MKTRKKTRWMKTTKCIVCLKKAVVFGGHVVSDEYCNVITGFCTEHADSDAPNLLNRVGCYGHYDEKYGLQPY